jgi:hypothetical protein
MANKNVSIHLQTSSGERERTPVENYWFRFIIAKARMLPLRHMKIFTLSLKFRLQFGHIGFLRSVNQQERTYTGRGDNSTIE